MCHLFYFSAAATAEIYTLSLHDALPISRYRLESGSCEIPSPVIVSEMMQAARAFPDRERRQESDRKSTRLNSSHVAISYAVFCLKKKITSVTEVYAWRAAT